MKGMRRFNCAVGLMLAAAMPLAAIAQSTSEAWRSVTDARLHNPEPGDWAGYRRTDDATGFSPLTQITPDNVKGLRAVWSFSFKDNSRWTPTPIVVNGMMYIAQGSGRVVAMNAATGDVVWIHERTFPQDISISQGYNRSRGVAVAGDIVYWGTGDSYLLALDARTGKELWEVKTGDYHSGDGHNQPPLIADGKVFLGHTGGDRTARGRFRAFDALTGKLLWQINTAPKAGDPGYDTWANRAQVEPAGSVPWGPVSYDPKLKLVYFGTGQPTPWIEDMRGTGKALYSNAIIAADADTGKIRWHFQTSPNDNWDRDSVFESTLVDLEIGGKTVPALIHTGKIGWGVVLNRVTGKFISAFRTAYENVITGWTKDGVPITDPAFHPKAADIDAGKSYLVCPHLHGGRDLNASSFSPLTKLYYVGINNTCMTTKVTRIPFKEGSSMGATSGKAVRVPGYDYVGEMVAYDPVTGKRAWTWRAVGGHAMSASVLTTGSGLLFGGTVDRQFFALDASSGKLLWQNRMSGDVSGAPVTFTVGGRQYVAMASGGRPGHSASFAPLTNVTVPDGSGSITVYALPDERDLAVPDKAAPPAIITRSASPEIAAQAAAAGAAPAAKTPVTGAPGSGAPAPAAQLASGGAYYTAAQAARGDQVFHAVCMACHTVADHTGASFQAKWGKGTAAPLFVRVSMMPENAPGSLPKDDYIAVMAYMMRESGFPAGKTPLPSEITELDKIPLH